MTTLWIGAPDDVRTGDAALDAIRAENDAGYYDQTYGIYKVSKKRWLRAQGYESRGWLHCWADSNNDRSQAHADMFNNYQALKNNLGHVCEVGCGPFTQLKHIATGRTIDHVTLVDPLINSYKKLRHCPYKHGSFSGSPTTIRQQMAEAIVDFAAFDTIICINVLEHVMSVPDVLNNLHRALKVGGTLVFGEVAFDDFDPHYTFDAGHPIHLKRPLLDAFQKRFNILFSNNNYFIGTR